MRVSLLGSIVLLAWLLTGCSGDVLRTSPKFDGFKHSEDNLLSLPIIGFDGNTAIGLLGAYNLILTGGSMDMELTPVRTNAIGESYIVSGSAFFTITPCVDCLKVSNIALNPDETISLGMKIKHPFPKGDPYKPPTARNRLDLDVFDIALILIPINTPPVYYYLSEVDVLPGLFQNADGYTRELVNVIGDSAAAPFKICFESESNNRFEMGTDYHPFEIILSPGEYTEFALYLTMGYGASAKKSQRLDPTYYVPEFNRKSAWKVVVTPPEGDDPPSSGNTWVETDTTTEHTVTIDIYDWNHGVTIASEYPDPNNTNHLSASSDISIVTVEIPGMTSAIVNAITSDTSTNGWDDPITYTASMANENALPAGRYTGLVKVIDSRVPGVVTIGGETDTLVHTDDGIILQWKTVDEFATYQTFYATVVGNVPVCHIDVVTPMPYVGWEDLIEFNASASYDPLGHTLIYEWDFNDDGIFGDTYEAGTAINPFKFFNTSYAGQVCLKLTRATAPGEAICCVDVDITAYPTKNIDISNGTKIARDIAIDPRNGDVLAYYEEGDVRRYFHSEYYTDFETYTCFWASEENLGTHNPDRDYFETGDYIDINPNGDFIIAVHRRYNSPSPYTYLRWVWGYIYRQDGTLIANHSWNDTYTTAWQAHVFDGHAFGGSSGARSNDMGFTWEYGSGGVRENNHVTWQDPVYTGFPGCKEGGTGITGYPIVPFVGCRVAGTETDKNTEYLWIVMKQNTVAWLWRLNPVLNNPSQSWVEIGPRFGTYSIANEPTLFTPLPYQYSTTSDDGLYCAQDITRDNLNQYYILDRHYASEPFEYKIKTFTYTLSPPATTPHGSFGESSDWQLTPKRIEGSDFDGKVVVLHTINSQSMISVFLEWETP